MIGAGQAIRAADFAQIAERGAIARQQKMIAVVDGHADESVVIGPAAAAGESGRLVNNDMLAAASELDRRGQAGEAGTDNVHNTRHGEIAQKKLRSTIRRNFALGRRTRWRGGLKPRAIKPLRIR